MQAISALCQKYPRKHSVMMTFLSNMLRDDVGGLLFNCGKLLASVLIKAAFFIISACLSNNILNSSFCLITKHIIAFDFPT